MGTTDTLKKLKQLIYHFDAQRYSQKEETSHLHEALCSGEGYMPTSKSIIALVCEKESTYLITDIIVMFQHITSYCI